MNTVAKTETPAKTWGLSVVWFIAFVVMVGLLVLVIMVPAKGTMLSPVHITFFAFALWHGILSWHNRIQREKHRLTTPLIIIEYLMAGVAMVMFAPVLYRIHHLVLPYFSTWQ